VAQPDVTALIVSYNTGPVLEQCLAAVLSDEAITRVILVDNGNPATRAEWLDEQASAISKLSVLRPGENLGFGRAVNLAAREVEEGHLLILNPDAVLRSGAVAALQETALQQTPPWIVGGKIVDETGVEQRGARRRALTLWRAMTSFLGFETWALNTKAEPAGPVPMPVITGAFFLTSKASFSELGGFDETYFLHVEDVDLCQRCRDAGGHVMYDPRALAEHVGASSEAPSKLVAGYKADSLALYFRRHAKGPLERILAGLVMPVVKQIMVYRAR